MTKLPTPKEIAEAYDYDPKTGVFTRRGTKIVAGSLSLPGHIIIRVGDRMHLAHRLAWATYYGEAPTTNLHHINGNRADNRIANLRLTQPKPRKVPKVSSSGVRGVHYHTTGKWQASVRIKGQLCYLGLFDTIAEASSRVEGALASGIAPVKRTRTNPSGIKGVYWNKPTKKWLVMLKINGKLLNLGVYKDKEDAVRRVEYARENPEAILIEKGLK
jgi:hypothetical protein